MKLRGIAIFLAFIPLLVSAHEQLGPVHPIIEPHLLNEIYATLKKKESTGDLARLQREAIERSKKSADSPKPVEGLSRTVKARTYFWDPSIVLGSDIRDAEGNLVAPAGQRVNPLDHVNLPEHLLLFDGRDDLQVKKANQLILHYEGQIKPIMIGGSVSNVVGKIKTRVYFDQQGSIVKKLGIQQVPALVTQEGKKLRIDEMEVDL